MLAGKMNPTFGRSRINLQLSLSRRGIRESSARPSVLVPAPCNRPSNNIRVTELRMDLGDLANEELIALQRS